VSFTSVLAQLSGREPALAPNVPEAQQEA
jgi:hypothetical protein